ncbi:MAG: hypothetical protein Q8P24_10490 [Desulfobacterales bacterium]|nr:hypothetical protein [Desulfobacterales bacterium]
MSSILKALKKLENNLPEEKMLKPLHRKVQMKQTFANTARGLGLRHRMFYILLAAPLLFFGGWLFFNYGTDRAARISAPVGTGPAAGTLAKLEPAERKRPPVASQVKPVTAPSAAAPVSFPKPAAPPRPPSVADGSGAMTARKEPAMIPPAVAGQSSVRWDTFTIVEGSPEPGFEIQAIAWSNIPEKRIAVINGKVVHEGAYIDGAYVFGIRLNDVSLKKGDKTWRVKFAQGP